MRLKKKTAVILSFALGTVMFASTAIAEVVSKSGYDQLKDSIKYTAESCTTTLSSYTTDLSFVVKDNGSVIFSNSSIGKYDVSKKAAERVSTDVKGTQKRENYYYSDQDCFISKDSDQNIYYVNEYGKKHESHDFKNPFKEKEAGDVEKIADALVGNLKDAVVITQNPDGTKTLSGSISESQIPALVNAIVSFQSKKEFGNQRGNDSPMPKIVKDVYVKEVKGNMVTTKDGLIQSVLGTGVISGKDEEGKEHTVTFELLAKVSNVNSTKVSKPDLSGKKVEKTVERDDDKLTNPGKYIGTYKDEVLIEKDGKFQKVGDRFIEITKIDEKGVSGRYYEEYAKGFEEYSSNKKEFTFEAKFEKDRFSAPITVKSGSSTIKGNLYIEQHSATIYFDIDRERNGNLITNGQYSRVFN